MTSDWKVYSLVSHVNKVVSHNCCSSQKQPCLANKRVFKNIHWKCLCLVPEKETNCSCSTAATCTEDEAGQGQVLRACPFTYFQAYIWENTVLPKAEYLVCAFILWALWINYQYQGISVQADLGNTTLHPLMGGRDKGKKPFPAHSGSATLHAGPDTEISVMSFSFAFYQEIIQCAYRKLLGKGDEFM